MEGEVAGKPWSTADFGRACCTDDLARVRELTSPEHMAACRSGTVDLNAGDSIDERTGLMWACACGSMRVVRYLTSTAMLAAGIDVNKGDWKGTSPLAAAIHCQWAHGELVRHLLESPDLAAAGRTVDVNAADAEGLTALHYACKGPLSPEVMSLLLRKPQLDLGARNKDGKTALQLAEANTRRNGHGAEKAALIREAMHLRVARRYLLVVALWSRREGAAAAATAGSGAAAAAAPAVPAGTLDEEDEEARARRRLMGGLPSHLLQELWSLV